MPRSATRRKFRLKLTMSTTASEREPVAAFSTRGRTPDLSVIIVNYNVREFLEQALRSVFRAGAGLKMEVFVVDNNSVDGSTAMVQSDFPDVHLIVNEDNIGFGRANNQAIRCAKGRFILILNPDTIVQEDTFSTLVAFMDDHPDAGAVGCKILHPDGTFARESRRAFPTPAVALYRMIGLASAFPRNRTFGRYNMTYLPEDEVAEVDALSGSCMLVRRAALLYSRDRDPGSKDDGAGWKNHRFRSRDGAVDSKDRRLGPGDRAGDSRSRAAAVADPGPGMRAPDFGSPCTGEWGGAGLFDESFFMYGEDLDWCFRIQQAGWKIYYTPETQIIHYKGESTKKGELRYVRLFYGAMLRFTEKHFESRYSRLFAALMRAGILVRAALSVAGGGLRRLAWPLLDFGTVYTIASLVAASHAELVDARVSPLFLAAVAPAYGLGAVTGIAALGGYGRRRRIRSVWGGILVGMLVVASVSFFVKDLAFSRMVILLTLPVSAAIASIFRLFGARRNETRGRTRRAVLIGHRAEAYRLEKILSRHPQPPFVLEGFVETDDERPVPNGYNGSAQPLVLGRLSQLRDIIRLRQIDDVVFASAALTNQTIFRLIQRLRDLPIHFRILAEGRDHVIGKASVDDLSMVNLVEAEETLIHPRSPVARKAFELAVAVPGWVVHPLIRILAVLGGADSFAARLARRSGQLSKVIAGRRSLIGYDPRGYYVPPAEWGLRDGVFVVTDAVDLDDTAHDEMGAAYWFYVRNQSASLDWDIIVRSLQRLRVPEAKA